nr:MAG TPA: hypothetical protein [Caudoviricetes sp.]
MFLKERIFFLKYGCFSQNATRMQHEIGVKKETTGRRSLILFRKDYFFSKSMYRSMYQIAFSRS